MSEQTKDWFFQRRDFYSSSALDNLYNQTVKVAEEIIGAYKKGNKVLVFGNGGSAAEAQHFAAELVCQFEKKRKALPAIALTTDTSIITAEANDYGFEIIFARQIEALGNAGDIAIGLTTSDAIKGDPHSADILEGFKKAREKGLISIGLFSSKTKNLLEYVDKAIVVPHTNTAIIQEAHLAAIHLICKIIEEHE